MNDTANLTLQEKIALAKGIAEGSAPAVTTSEKVDVESTNNPPSTDKEHVDSFGRALPYPEKEHIDIPHNVPPIDPAANGNGISDPTAEKPNADAPEVTFQDSIQPVATEEQVPEPNVEEALAKGIRVFKKQDMNYFIRRDGSKVPPTAAGYFFAIDTEMEKGLEYFATKQFNLVEEVTK